MNFRFGKSQLHTSKQLQRYPQMAKLIHFLFGYTLVANYARATVFIKILKKLPYQQFKKVLDIGCGWGEYAFMMAEGLPKASVTALDVKANNLNEVEAAIPKMGVKNLVTHLGDVKSLQMDRESLDFAYAVDVFEHIDEKEMPFQEVYQLLKPGGYLLVKVPNATQNTLLPNGWFSDHHDWLEDEHIGQVYDLEQLKARFRAEGYTITFASYSDGIISRLAWEVAYFAERLGHFTKLLFLPLSKMLVQLDRLVHHNRSGNAIQVVGQKPLAGA